MSRKWYAIKDGANYIGAGSWKSDPTAQFPGKTVEEYDTPQQSILDSICTDNKDPLQVAFDAIDPNDSTGDLKTVIQYLQKVYGS
jgi:hypothetical protein